MIWLFILLSFSWQTAYGSPAALCSEVYRDKEKENRMWARWIKSNLALPVLGRKIEILDHKTNNRFSEVRTYQWGPFVMKIRLHHQSLGTSNTESHLRTEVRDQQQMVFDEFSNAGAEVMKEAFPRRFDESFMSTRGQASIEKYRDHSSEVVIFLEGKPLAYFRLIYAPYLTIQTPYGIRTLPWPKDRLSTQGQFKWSDFSGDHISLPVELFFREHDNPLSLARPHIHRFPSQIRIEGQDFPASIQFITEVSSYAAIPKLPPALQRTLLAGLLQSLVEINYHDPYHFRQDLDPTIGKNRYRYSMQSQTANSRNLDLMFSYGDKTGALLHRPLGLRRDKTVTIDYKGEPWYLLRNRNYFNNSLFMQISQAKGQEVGLGMGLLSETVGYENVEIAYGMGIDIYSGQWTGGHGSHNFMEAWSTASQRTGRDLFPVLDPETAIRNLENGILPKINVTVRDAISEIINDSPYSSPLRNRLERQWLER